MKRGEFLGVTSGSNDEPPLYNLCQQHLGLLCRHFEGRSYLLAGEAPGVQKPKIGQGLLPRQLKGRVQGVGQLLLVYRYSFEGAWWRRFGSSPKVA